MTAISHYLHQIETAVAAGNATEHTHRPALKAMLESLGTGIVATNEPKRIKCGAPDYILTRGQTPLGYVEAKDVGKPLGEVEKTDQLKRYLESLGNLVLTDYLEFRWYVAGQHRMTASLGTVTKNKVKADAGNAEAVEQLLCAFLNAQTPTVNSPRELAQRMAHLARLTRDAIRRAFEDEDQGGALHLQMEGFRKTLLHDLTEEQFADMYAQTIAYGLFAARCNVPDGAGFSREHAAYDLPRTNPFLRRMFSHIAGPDLDERIVWVVDDLAALLARADMPTILADFGKRTRQEDPIVHFYETFLAAYDPKMREARGVYYTPEPVVSYLVRSVDHILKTAFKLPDGLADASKVSVKFRGEKEKREVHKVQILDPAAGTGTFAHGIIDHIYETNFAGNKGMWSGYVRDHLLPRLFGFELLMAPYAVAHLKLGLQLRELGYNFESNERLRVYLTNSLEEADEYAGMNLFAQWIADEANAAAQVKQDMPVMVVIGNPPYAVSSQNKGGWVSGLVRDYYQVDGKPLGERNPKSLQDDYVKFIRFSQHRIEQTGYGILAFICNHGYLDNATFRGMRRSLMDSFDDIYLLDLHGNINKKEIAPDGMDDQNVFDIQQGVAIGIFVRKSGAKKREAIVHHAHLWGKREGKYNYLSATNVGTTGWTELSPHAPNYLFIPQNMELKPEYEVEWSVADAMPVHSGGMNTARDALVVDTDRNSLQGRIQQIADATDLEKVAEALEIKDTGWWNFKTAAAQLKETQAWQSLIIPCLYRPYDVRWLFHHKAFIDRPRTEVNSHMQSDNLSLVTTRQTKEPFAAIATRLICGQHKIAAVYDRSYAFPLYLYGGKAKAHLFDDAGDTAPAARRPNLAPEFIGDFAARLEMEFIPDGKGDRQATFGPEDVFSYMYAIFHTPTYRSRYAEFLKADFPRLPLTSNADLFRELCVLGDELVGLHLIEKRGPHQPGFPVAGDNIVDAVRYATSAGNGAAGRVWINQEQYFEGVTPETWEFQVGGYQVAQKWLKDRKGRALSYDDLRHYQWVIAALGETIRLMAAVDAAIDAHDGWPIK